MRRIFFAPILLLLVFCACAHADVGLYPVTKQNLAQVKEFNLQTTSVGEGKMEFRISIPYDASIKKVKIEDCVWSDDQSRIVSTKAIAVSQSQTNGPWMATVTVGVEALKNSTIEVFCTRNLPAETAYRIQLASFAVSPAERKP